jgi:hypothetical protein
VSTHASYRRTQAFLALWIMLPLSSLAITALALNQRDSAVLGVLAMTWCMSAAALALLGRFAIEVRGNELHWAFGYLGWPRWHIGIGEIARTDVGRPSAWRGAGIKGLGSNRLYTASMGGPALQLTLHDGRKVTLGTPEPDRLDAILRARMEAR